ncbi:MAG TPA: hypothetical protein VHV83_16785, partial [Armatimonadota bacterium]|nr:hypothetical protein [Armatimonadota bacterium]
CSLHVMDVKLLKTFISAMHGGPVPDLKAEVERRCHHDIVLNWSRRIIRAAAPLEAKVPREQWTLYTTFRPFFITTDDSNQAAQLVESFVNQQSLEEVLDLFREEIARIDPDQADAIVETAKQDKSPGLIEHYPIDEAVAHYRTYILYERRQFEAMTKLAESGQLTPKQLIDTGRRLSWRTCTLLANFHPSWFIHNTSLTSLACRKDLGIENLVADPRGMYAEFIKRIPKLHDTIPFSLAQENQTGLCIPPKCVPALLTLMAAWPQPIMPHPTFGVPTPGEVQALHEALIYASHQQAGVWEASGLFVPENDVFSRVLPDQGEREDHPEKFVKPVEQVETSEVTTEQKIQQRPNATVNQADSKEIDQHEEIDKDSDTEEQKSWLQKFFKR